MASVRGKRYFVFAGDHAKMAGGWSDFIAASDSADAAIAKATDAMRLYGKRAWAQVIDTEVSLPVWQEGL